MTTSSPVHPTSPAIPSASEGPQTDLISQLAKQLFAEVSGRGSGSSAATRDPGLTNGYPSGAHAGTPPVHPGVPGAAPGPDASPSKAPTRKSTAGTEDSYEFGEPRNTADLTGVRHKDRSSEPSRGHDRVPSLHVPEAAPDLYFLPKSIDPARSTPVVSGINPSSPAPAFDVEGVRRDFPILHQHVNGRPLIWLDNAATTQKPQSVIDATSHFYSRDNSNIHRAAHALAARSTDAFEGGREKVRQFIGAADAREIVFLRGTTEAINLVAQSYGRQNIGAGDEILITTIEHHANIVPWQLLAAQTGAVLRIAPVNDKGELIMEQFATLLSGRTKLVSVTHVANSLGTVNPVEAIIALAHAYGVPVLLDAAQSSPHLPVNVTALDVDFLAFSGHKVFGPTGIGVLYGKSHLLESMPPWQGGGHMIKDVTFARTTYQNAPEKFEAGTPDIAGVVGLGAALDYLTRLGMPAIAAYEHTLLEYATHQMSSIPGLRLVGTATNKASVLSFLMQGYKPAEVAKYLDQHGIATRAGHHCAQPALRRLGTETSVRASLAFYNTPREVDTFVRVLRSLPKK